MSHTANPQTARPDPLPTLLVVEDEVLIRLAIAEYLRECGYVVHEASSVAEAQAVLDAIPDVELVFSDVQLRDEETGFILATWIRRYHPHVQIILTSGLHSAAEKARDLCNDTLVIPKPYDHEVVLMRVQEAVRKSRNARESRAGE